MQGMHDFIVFYCREPIRVVFLIDSFAKCNRASGENQNVILVRSLNTLCCQC